MTSTSKKLTILASIGAGVEYYDFIIYGLLATYLSQAFFPGHDSMANLLKTFAIFALGYLVRPVGGLIFGSLGDRYGRKKIFLSSLLLMAVSTLGIGLIPTYAQWGILASCLLVLCRILQGLAFGAEIPSTVTFVAEHAHQTKRGLHCGIVLAFISLGATTGSLIIYLLNNYLTPTQMAAWGWRIPFCLGSSLAILGYFIRKRIQETPLFIQHVPSPEANKQPIAQLFTQYPKYIALGIGVCLFAACIIIFGISLPAYLKQFHTFDMKNLYLSLTLGLVWSTLILPFLGWYSDRIGRRKLLAVVAGFIVIAGFPLFMLLHQQKPWSLLVFMLLYETIISIIAVCFLPLLAELFPTKVRLSGVAFCYNIIYSLAGLTPLLLAKLVQVTGVTFYTPLFFILLALLTLGCLTQVKEQTGMVLR